MIPASRGRRSAAAVLALMFALLLAAAITAVWLRGTVLSTSGYVAATAPLASDPPVRAAVRTAVEDEVSPLLDRALATELPSGTEFLARPIGGRLTQLLGASISAVMATPAFTRLWIAANQAVHRQLISVLDGTSDLLATAGGNVVLNVAPLIDPVLREVSRRLSALTGETLRVASLVSTLSASCRRATACGQVPLFRASGLISARRAFRAVRVASIAVLILTPLIAIGALLVAPRRRRVLLYMAGGGILAVLAASLAISRMRSSLAPQAPPPWGPAATAILHALTHSYFATAMWGVIGCLVVAAGVLVAGTARYRTGRRATSR